MIVWIWVVETNAQNLHIQTYLAPIRTVYNVDLFNQNTSGALLGLRLAMGADRYQLGVEVEGAISDPSFISEEDMQRASYSVLNSYSGMFVRANFSSIPVYRLGVIGKIGVGRFENTIIRQQNGEENFSVDYPDPALGGNIAIGLSGPIRRWFHWDFTYQVSYHRRPDLNFDQIIVEAHNAWLHAFQFGISVNLVWGKARRKAQELILGRGY